MSDRTTIGPAESVIEVFRVDSRSNTTYRFDEQAAQDAVTAYALRDEVAMMSSEHVSSELVSVDWDGTLIVGLPWYEMCPSSLAAVEAA